MGLKQEIYEKVIAGDANAVQESMSRAIDEGFGAGELLNDTLIAAMAEVGERFERREYFVPEMLVAARAMKTGVEVLRPLLAKDEVHSLGTVVIGTVEGDLHDIGKNLVVLMLEGAGFEVRDLGVDVSPSQFLEAIHSDSPGIVGMSALLTTTMLNMRNTVAVIEEAGLRDNLAVMIGGAPVTQRYADEIGADIYANDASEAARKAQETILSRMASHD